MILEITPEFLIYLGRRISLDLQIQKCILSDIINVYRKVATNQDTYFNNTQSFLEL